MKNSYKAIEVSEPGVLRIVERAVPEPGAGQVRIGVEACGICHTDAATITGIYPGLKLPRVPGHEVVAALRPWAAAYPNGKSVNASVSASSAVKMGCANRADAETWCNVRTPSHRE